RRNRWLVSDWSSDVCSSDLAQPKLAARMAERAKRRKSCGRKMKTGISATTPRVQSTPMVVTRYPERSRGSEKNAYSVPCAAPMRWEEGRGGVKGSEHGGK